MPPISQPGSWPVRTSYLFPPKGLWPIPPEFTSMNFMEIKKQTMVGSTKKPTSPPDLLKCCGFVFMWPQNICAHVYACVWDMDRHETKLLHHASLNTHLNIFTWISAKPHVLSMSTNCLICSNPTCMLTIRAGLEIGALGWMELQGASIQHIVNPYGLVEMAAGWGPCRLLQAKSREAHAESQNQAEDVPRARRAFWNIWEGPVTGWTLGEGGGEREKWSLPDQADFFPVQMLLAAAQVGECVQLH